MRRFSAAYLAHTRQGLWEDRAALQALRLDSRQRIVDVGCGTGALTRVLREESPATVIGVDLDSTLLDAVGPPRLHGDACRLPLRNATADLVVCQALLINLPEPSAALEEFARVSSDRVAVIEPDNASVRIDSTVTAEASLSRRARDLYTAGVPTDLSVGGRTSELFANVGLSDIETERHQHVRRIEPPYDTATVEGAARKATAARLAETRATLRAGGLDDTAYDAFREAWRAMGRSVVEQIQAGEYERTETVPFEVTVGRV